MKTKQIFVLLFVLFLFFLLFVQATISTLPLLLPALIVLHIRKNETWVLIMACVGGLLLDVLLVRTFGQGALLFVFLLLLVSFYERKFETDTIPFVTVASFLGSLFYLYIYETGHNIVQALISACFAALLFFAMRKTHETNKHFL